MADTPLQQLNPLTPLAYLSPAVAVQFEVSRYLYAGTFGAFLWDWIMSLSEEYRMISLSNRGFPFIVYYIARVGTLSYVVTGLIFQTTVVHDCNALQLVIGISFFLAMPAASFLFYLRIRAIFFNNPIVRASFVVLWLSVLGTSMAIPFAIRGAHIGPTQYCINSVVKPYASSSVITCAINDTLILIAISYKLAKNNNMNSSWQDIVRSFFTGHGLSSISKSLYQSGVMYYLVTVSMNMLTIGMVFTPSAPPVYRAMITVPNIALQNMMACRVFRQLLLGIIGKVEAGSSVSAQSMPLKFRSRRSVRQRTIGIESNNPGTTFGAKARPMFDEASYGSNVMDIKVTKDVEVAMDPDV